MCVAQLGLLQGHDNQTPRGQKPQHTSNVSCLNVNPVIKKQKKNNIALNGTNLPLLCSHPSLTITTLVMLVARMEDPGFSQGETTLSPKFPSLSPAQEPGDRVLEFIAVFSMVVTY